MKIIDAHHHAWKYNPIDYDWISDEMPVIKKDFLLANLKSTFKENQVDGSVVVQAVQSEKDTLFLLELAEKSDVIRGVVGWVDLQSEDIEDRLEYFSKFSKIKGFRHVVQAEPDPNFMLGTKFQRGIAALSQYDFTYDILVFPNQLTAAIKLAQNFPHQSFVLDHIAKPYIKDCKIDQWQKNIKVLALSENVFCKVSGMVTEANLNNWSYDDFVPYLDVVFESFGVDRIMFGSDYPVCLLAASYAEVRGLITKYTEQFSDQDQLKVFRSNATRFYKL